MSYQSQFNRELDRLYKRRTAKLRDLLTGKPGRPLGFSKKKRESKIRQLEEIASKALAKKTANQKFGSLITQKRIWRTKGWGADRKRKNFLNWIDKRISPREGKIYIFWKNGECLYVGLTQGSGSRPGDHFERSWFRSTTRIDVYTARQSNTIHLLECLAIHRFQPTKNKIKAARKKWAPKCPLCRIHKKIRRELRQIFRVR